MPFKPVAGPEDYPERLSPRRPWDEWGPEHQRMNLMKALGIRAHGSWLVAKKDRARDMGVVRCPAGHHNWFVVTYCRKRQALGLEPCVGCTAPDHPMGLMEVVFDADGGSEEQGAGSRERGGTTE